MPETAIGPDGFPTSDFKPPNTGVELAPGGEADARARGVISPVPAFQAAPAVAPEPLPDRSVAHKLAVAVSVGGVQHYEIRIHPVTTGDRAVFDRAAGSRALKNVIRLLRTSVGFPVSPDVIDALDPLDTDSLIEAVQPLLAPYFAKLPKPAAFAGDQHRRMVFLDAAIDFDGKVYDRIEVRRLTAREIDAHYKIPAELRGLMPSFYDEDGVRVPDEVVHALAPEDMEAVSEAVDAFTPRVLKADKAPGSTSALESGETSPQR